MTKIIGIIPARMGSSRFPGKPLAKINGIPMVGHVYYRSKMSETLDEVYESMGDLTEVKIVDHMGFGEVVRVDAVNQNFDWQKLG